MFKILSGAGATISLRALPRKREDPGGVTQRVGLCTWHLKTIPSRVARKRDPTAPCQGEVEPQRQMLTSAIISGLGLGSMYGLIALGFHVTYVVSNTVNFSQGSAMMLGAVLGYTFAVTLGWPLPLAAAHGAGALRAVRRC